MLQDQVREMVGIWRKLLQRLLSLPLWFKILGSTVAPATVLLIAVSYFTEELVFQFFSQNRYDMSIAEFHAMVQQRYLLIGFGAYFLILLITYGLSRILSNPLDNLLHAIQQAECGDYSNRLNPKINDEIGQLQAAFDRMIDNLQSSQAAIQRQHSELQFIHALSEIVAIEADVQVACADLLKQIIPFTQTDVGVVRIFDDSIPALALTKPADAKASEMSELEISLQDCDQLSQLRNIDQVKAWNIDD